MIKFRTKQIFYKEKWSFKHKSDFMGHSMNFIFMIHLMRDFCPSFI